MEFFDLSAWSAQRRDRIDRRLAEAIPSEETPPMEIHRAMRYATLAPGKRIRPLLCAAAADALGADAVPDPDEGEHADDVVRLGCALELVHSYSLVHDDLPAMDDDTWRRGRLTVHKVFGEAAAILVGDALLTLAFEEAAGCAGNDRYPAARYVTALATAVGSRGLVAGQATDLEAEGTAPDADTVRFIHRNKTARLIRCAVELGGMAAGAADDDLDRLRTYGDRIGLAFQIVDDLLDLTGDLASLGKQPGADAALRKSTWPAVFGIDRSRADARDLVDEALSAVEPFDADAAPLRAIGRLVIDRES